MRACPPCQVQLRHFGVWRAALGALALAGSASLAAWLAHQPPPVSMTRALLAAAVELPMLACVVWLWRVRAQDLRWDGKRWQLDGIAGELSVAIDLGAWMLLRFDPPQSWRGRWVPVQRRGLEGQWHALRCAVHSPRPLAEP